tara:strand:- start:2928 stop:3719 length:792 start_codon:yes stop_codon:yes gene_type:complete
MSTKFKSDPYNPNNHYITSEDVLNIFSKVNIKDIKIKDLSLYQIAFNHKSYCYMKDYEEYEKPENCIELQKTSYENMEFLGDALLDVVIAEYLYKRYKDQNEGFLTKIKTRLVNGEQESYYSNCLEMNSLVLLSKHVEDNCDGRNNTHILEDVFEAFIGSIYLDTNDFLIVKRFIINLIEKYVDFPDLIMNDKNYKEQIMKYLQHNYNSNPTYEHLPLENDIFRCKIIHNLKELAIGEGKTKKKAEQDAAYRALVSENVLSDN